MHRLRTRKKGKADEDAPPLPTIPSGKSFLKRNKAAPAPEKPDLETTLETALPSSDDFRMSLLMPNLANRFSILKEQEAAAAAASQGSVGQGGVSGGGLEVGDPQYNPSRYSNLGDIAESDSTHGLVQSSNRYTSKSDEGRTSEGRVSEDGSIMGRGRTGDGNVLFGGRQKIYKVPNKALRGGTSSTEDLRSESPVPSGRALYQPDLRDPTTRPRNRDEEPLKITTDGIDQPEYNKNRYTSSSTNSTPASMNGFRGSTAATSINSQQPSKSVPQSPTAPSKPRKALYEQALDQQLQEQQTNAMGRLERLASLTRQQTSSPPPSRNESPMGGNFNRMHGTPSSPRSVRALPWPSKMDSPTVAPLSPGSRKGSHHDVAPTTPLADFDFGLPIRSAPRAPSRTQSPVRASRASSVSHDDAPVVAPLSPRGGAPQHRIEETHNDGSHATFLSMSSNSESYADQDLMMQQIERELETEKPKSSDVSRPSSPMNGRPASGTGSAVSSLSDHSAKPEYQAYTPEALKNPQASATSPQFLADIHSTDDDSPTLPPGGGLSLLVRQHLRSDSGSSSVYAGSNYARQSRMSRMSRYGMDQAPPVPSNELGVGKEKRASGSSAGNMWQYEEFDTSPYDREGTRDGAGSPTSIYPPTLHAPPSPPPPMPAVPQIPIRAEEQDRSGSRTGQRSDSRTGQRSDSRTGQRSDSRTGQRSDSRTGRRPEVDRNEARARSTSRPADRTPPLNDEDSERDWEEQLAYRRQIIQQNLRNQEKIQSQHDMAWESESPHARSPIVKSPPGGAFQALRAKTSNGFLKGEGKNSPKIEQPPRLMRPGPGRPSEEHVRLGPSNGVPLRVGPPGPFSPHSPRPGINHSSTHPGPGPHGMAGPGPRTGPPQRPRRPSEQAALAAKGETERPPRSPMNPGPRLRQQGSREQMAGTRSGETTPRGAPMGWNDQHPSRTPRTQPSTPVTPSTPVAGPSKGPQGLHDDLARAMMTGQSQTDTDRFVTARRPGLTREPSAEDVKSTFESSSRRSNFMRPRGNSILSPSPSSSDLAKHVNPPPLPITTSIPSSGAESDSRGVTPPKSPDAELIQAIQNTNAAYQPARKRAVSKFNISVPTLLSSTSSIPTIDLPAMPPMPAIHAAAAATARPRRKTGTSSRERFGFSRRTSEEAPAIPTGVRSDDESDHTTRLAKLRKSTSDGGGLSARMKLHDMAGKETMPKVNTKMVGHPMVMRNEPAVVAGEGVGGARMI